MTSRSDFETYVTQCAATPDSLLPLLDEASDVYAERSGRQVARMRGFVLATLASAGTPDAALPFILEELENGRDAYSVAAAARAVRGMAAPTAQTAELLVTALRNIRFRDDAIVLETCGPVGFAEHYTTAVAEILESLAKLASTSQGVVDELRDIAEDSIAFSPHMLARLHATIAAIERAPEPTSSCCGGSLVSAIDHPEYTSVADIADITAVDQDGNTLTLGAYYLGSISVVGFFYTRCDNPNKCELTVARLAILQKRLRDIGLAGVNVSAISYDPGHDTPALLKTYGQSRGFQFGAAHRFLRSGVADMSRIRAAFHLGVNYAGSVVNHHRIELYVVARNGMVSAQFARLRWDEDEVVNELAKLLP